MGCIRMRKSKYMPNHRVDSNVDIFNTTLGYKGILNDPLEGKTRFTSQLVFSPGDLSSRNKDSSFEDAKSSTDSSYIYGRISLDRTQEFSLPFLETENPFFLVTHLEGQLSNRQRWRFSASNWLRG